MKVAKIREQPAWLHVQDNARRALLNPQAIGVCSWCLDRQDIQRAIELAGRHLTVDCVQIGFFVSNPWPSTRATSILRLLRKFGLRLVGTFVGFNGEDYSSIERIASTGGYVPDSSFASRLEITRNTAILTANLGASRMALHAGTIPNDPDSSLYVKLLKRVEEAADTVADYGVRLLLETGSEPVDVLIGFLDALGRDNVGVNLDSGNFVAYGTDEPVRAVTELANRIENVHLKDAVRSSQPGVEYGTAVSLGSGDADIPRVVAALQAVGYQGPLLVETSGRECNVRAVQKATRDLCSLLCS